MATGKRRSEYPVLINPPDAIGSGAKTVAAAATAETLVASSTPCKMVKICGKTDNTGDVYIGGSTVAAGQGMTLVPRQDTGWFPISDLVLIYVDVAQNGEGVDYVYLA